MENRYTVKVLKKIIYIDGSPYVNNFQGGIGHYTEALINQLSLVSNYEVRIVLFRGQKPPMNSIPKNVCIEYLPFNRRFYMIGWRFLHYSINTVRFLEKKPDVVIYPNFATIPKITAPSIITIIHDLAYIHYPEMIEKRNLSFLRRATNESIYKSTHIVTPSKFTKNEVTKYFNPQIPVIVAYPGYEKRITAKNSSPKGTTTPYILFVSTIEPRKNIATLCESFIESTLSAHGYRLVIIGKQGWGNVSIPNHPSILYLGAVSDEQKDLFLSHASAFIFPSFFEGFGMPVIEAMHHNIPIISSDSSSLKEIVSKDSAVIIKKPYGKKQITEALEYFYHNRDSNQFIKMSKKAHVCAKMYTWKNCGLVFKKIIDDTHQ